MCLFDTSNYFAAAGARARSCCMHLVPGWLQEMPGVIYMLSLKPRIWWLLQDPGLAFAVTIQMCFLAPEAAPCFGGHGDSRVLNASVPWALTWGDKFWSHAQCTSVNGTCTNLPSREKDFSHLSTTDFLKQFMCIEGEVITHFIKTLRTWFYLLI